MKAENMRGVLLHTIAGTSNLDIVGPVFNSEGIFKFIPIKSNSTQKPKSKQFLAHNTNDKALLSKAIPELSKRKAHAPECAHFTDVQPINDDPRLEAPKERRATERLFFFFNIASCDSTDCDYKKPSKPVQRDKKVKRDTGFFTIDEVAKVSVFKSEPMLTLASLRNNKEVVNLTMIYCRMLRH
ncbi:MAG: hypothetical protein NWF01_08570 [Candidatus Bathyarchaeota archaeon]|nr:hypothetical protein [Candidatus Bathyarchaeota archaeon]